MSEEMIDVVVEDRDQALRLADLVRRLVNKPPALIEHLVFEVAVWEVLERAKPDLAAACALDERVLLARVLGAALRRDDPRRNAAEEEMIRLEVEDDLRAIQQDLGC